jgi:predicted ABC-type ATPase
MAPPVCWIIAGTNGAGKSSIYRESREIQQTGEFVNADVLARKIAPEHPEGASASAGRLVIKRLDELIETGSDFVYETTLSSHQSIDIMKRCRSAGYRIGLMFVALSDVNLHIRRVRERVEQGGHDIPEETIRRRYDRAFANLPVAIGIAHEFIAFDNSNRETVRLIAIVNGALKETLLDGAKKIHRVIAEAVSTALGMQADQIFKTTGYP